MGIFFNNRKPRVSKDEWKKVRNSLSIRGLKLKEIDYIEGLFSGDMNELRESDRGIQEEEIIQRIEWLRKNTNLHTLSEDQIQILEEELRERL